LSAPAGRGVFFGCLLAAAWGLASFAGCQEAGPSISGLVGIGMESAGPAFPGPLGQAPVALSLRYWASETLGLDGLIALVSEHQSQSLDAAGNTAPATDSLVGVGVGARWNAFQPSPDVLVQFLARGSLVHLVHTTTDTPAAATFEAGSLDLSVGAAVEAFLPWWPSLSLEAGVTLVLARLSGNSDLAFVPSSNASQLAVMGSGFTPLQAGLHYYF
jgi:hypothetical protein